MSAEIEFYVIYLVIEHLDAAIVAFNQFLHHCIAFPNQVSQTFDLRVSLCLRLDVQKGWQKQTGRSILGWSITILQPDDKAIEFTTELFRLHTHAKRCLIRVILIIADIICAESGLLNTLDNGSLYLGGVKLFLYNLCL